MYFKDQPESEITTPRQNGSARVLLLAQEPWVMASDPASESGTPPAPEPETPASSSPPPRTPPVDVETKVEPAAESEVTRAEEMVDRLAVQVAVFTSILGKKLLWLGAHLREEAEDLWAEAQNIRRGEKP